MSIQDLDALSLPALKDLREAQRQILENKQFLEALEDRGVSWKLLLEQVEDLIRTKETGLKQIERIIISTMNETASTQPKLPTISNFQTKLPPPASQKISKELVSQTLHKPSIQPKPKTHQKQVMMLDTDEEMELEEMYRKTELVEVKNDAKRYLMEYARRSATIPQKSLGSKQPQGFCTGSISRFERLQISEGTRLQSHDTRSTATALHAHHVGTTLYALSDQYDRNLELGEPWERIDPKDGYPEEKTTSQESSEGDEDYVPSFLEDGFDYTIQHHMFEKRKALGDEDIYDFGDDGSDDAGDEDSDEEYWDGDDELFD